MKTPRRDIEFAIEVFVRGHAAGRSRTFPYEVKRVAPLWVMRDAPRKNPRDYRKEEWIAYDVHPKKADAIGDSMREGASFYASCWQKASRTRKREPPTRLLDTGCSRPKGSSCSG